MKNVHMMLALAAILLPLEGFGDNKVDSLKQLLRSDKAIDRAEVLWRIAYELYDVDNPQALAYADSAYHEVWKGGDSLQIVKLGTTYGQLLRRVGRLDESIAASGTVLPIAKRIGARKYIKMLLNSMGLAYVYKEDLARGLELHYESLRLRLEDGNQEEIMLTQLNLGYVHLRLGDYKQSIDYSLTALEGLRKGKDPMLLSTSMMNVGAGYIELGEYNLAKKYYDSANTVLVQARIENGNELIDYGFGRIYFAEGDLDKANLYLRSSFNSSQKRGNNWTYGLSGISLAEAALKRGNPKLCSYYLRFVRTNNGVNSYPRVMLYYYRVLSEYHSSQSDYKNALDAHKRYSESVVAVHGKDLQRSAYKAQMEYFQKEAKFKMESQAQILELQNDALRERLWIIVLCVVVIVLVIFSLAILMRQFRQEKRVAQLLDLRVKERTIELGHHRDLLNHNLNEAIITNQRACDEMIALTRTLKGLFRVGKLEVPEANGKFLDLAETTTKGLETAIEKLRSFGVAKSKMPPAGYTLSEAL